MIILAQPTFELPAKAFAPWFIGLLEFGSVVLLFLLIFYYGKKVFGRQPPINEELKVLMKHLKGEIAREKNSVLKEVRLTLSPLVERIEKAEGNIQDIQLDRQRKWEKLTGEMHQIATDVAFMRGQKKGEQS